MFPQRYDVLDGCLGRLYLPFVAAALAIEARVIITLNPGDFEPATRHGLRVLSPAQAKREFL